MIPGATACSSERDWQMAGRPSPDLKLGSARNRGPIGVRGAVRGQRDNRLHILEYIAHNSQNLWTVWRPDTEAKGKRFSGSFSRVKISEAMEPF